jgi:hypothetical protein
MALVRGEINPLGVLGMRKLSFIPEHFARITIKIHKSDIKILDQWINYNLNSRYAIKETIVLDESNKMVESIIIGMEDPKEITMFTLGCTKIHKQ